MATAVVLLAVVVGVTAGGGPAQAQTEPTVSLSFTPSPFVGDEGTVLVDLTTNTPGLYAVCQARPFGATGPGPCVRPHQLVDVGDHVQVEVSVRRWFPGPLGTPAADCAEPSALCFIFATRLQTGSPTTPGSGESIPPAALVPYLFVPATPPAVRGTVSVSPSSGVAHGEAVQVTGTGFRPNVGVRLHQCVAAPADPGFCTSGVAATTDATGAVSGSLPIQHLLGGVDCRTAPGTCVVAVAERSDFVGTVATAPLDLTVDQVVVVPGSGTPGAEGSSAATNRTVQVPVRLNTPAPAPVTVSWETFRPADLPGPAADPSDYVASSGTVTFTAGASSRTILIPVVGDTLDEDDEYLLVRFFDPTGGAVMGGFLGLGFGTIRDDDLPPLLVPGTAEVQEGDAGTTVIDVPVTLDQPSGRDVTVTWATRVLGHPVLPGYGEGTGGVDFEDASGSVTFPAGTTAATIPITVIGDTLDEQDELAVVQFTVDGITAKPGGLFALGFALIVDDDP